MAKDTMRMRNAFKYEEVLHRTAIEENPFYRARIEYVRHGRRPMVGCVIKGTMQQVLCMIQRVREIEPTDIRVNGTVKVFGKIYRGVCTRELDGTIVFEREA